MAGASHEATVERWRRDRDLYFRSDPESPIPPPERAAFRGVAWYPVDRAWRIVAPFEERTDGPVVVMASTGGDPREYRDVGGVTFDAPTGRATLHVYRPVGEDWDDLFVMFRDATSGKETYGAGRYLEPRLDEAPARILLDFNYAYAPFCAYNDAYSCTLPPRENWITIPVRAGERNAP